MAGDEYVEVDDGSGEESHSQIEEQQEERPFPFLELANELQLLVFERLIDLSTIRALSLACQETNALYKQNEKRITKALRDYYVDEISRYYGFLSTLHIDPEDILHPPSGGWPNLIKETAAGWNKTEFVMDLIRFLPYIRAPGSSWNDNPNSIDFNSSVIDRSKWRPEDRYASLHSGANVEEFVIEVNERMKFKHIVAISNGRGSGGVVLVLDTLTGVLHEEIVRMDVGEILPIHDYLEQRREMLRNCEQVYVPGWQPVSEPSEVYEYDEQEREEVEQAGEPSQPTELFGNIEDFRWVRHLYMQHGWPSPQWKKAEGMKAIEEYARRRHDEYED